MKRAYELFCLSLLGLGAWGCAAEGKPNPEAGKAYLEKGRQAAKSGNPQMALQFYSQAVAENPDFAEAYYERGRINVQLRLSPGDQVNPRSCEQAALDDFSMAVLKNPNYADAFFDRAMVLASRAQYKLAVDDLLNSVRYNPTDPEPHRWLGELYESKFEERIVVAMDHYEKYVDLGGTDPGVREKVRVWKDFKKQAATAPPPGLSKVSTPEDERKAAELHMKAMELFKLPDKTEAVRTLEELLANYSYTKYVQEKTRGLQALISAYRKKAAPK